VSVLQISLITKQEIDLTNRTVQRYAWNVILSFRDRDTEQFWQTGGGKKVPANLRRTAMRKLFMVHAASQLLDLRLPPGNRLEQLQGDRKGQHCIRINDQFRVCFIWREGNAYEVEIVDYH
jgi:toxin HigB-1